jgi:hypothetical protein
MITLPSLAGLGLAATLGCQTGLVEDGSELAVDKSALAVDNGIQLTNGLNLPNGIQLTNSIRLMNGLNLANGIQVENGMALSNSIRLMNGVAGPAIMPPSDSDLEKWIDSSPTNNLLILKDEIECALPPSVSVKVQYRGTLYGPWAGVAGLGPGWQQGLMTTDEQEAVSSCLIARVNASGQHVMVDMLGPMTGLNTVTATEQATYTYAEAFVFGNLFLPSPKAFFTPLFATAPLSAPGFPSCQTRICSTSATTCLADPSALTPVCGVVQYYQGLVVDIASTGSSPSDLPDWYATSVTDLTGQTWSHPITTYLHQNGSGTSCTFAHECASGVCQSNGTCQ